MSEPQEYMTVSPIIDESITQKRTLAFNTFHMAANLCDQTNKKMYNIADSQINTLFLLKYKDTDDFVFIEDENNKDIIYQIVGLFTEDNSTIYDEIIDIVKNSNVSNLKKMYYELSIFNIPKRKIKVEIDNIRDVLEVEDGAYICGNCSSSKTFSSSKQMAGGDEASTIFVVCVACGQSWKTRG